LKKTCKMDIEKEKLKVFEDVKESLKGFSDRMKEDTIDGKLYIAIPEEDSSLLNKLVEGVYYKTIEILGSQSEEKKVGFLNVAAEELIDIRVLSSNIRENFMNNKIKEEDSQKIIEIVNRIINPSSNKEINEDE